MQALQSLQHCSKIFFSKESFACCPNCGSVDVKNVKIESGIFQNAPPRSVLVRKTSGSLLSYSQTALLHVGVTNSHGDCYNFDEKGRKIERWPECLAVPLLASAGALSDTEWDDALNTFMQFENTDGRSYHSMNNNCYDFVLRYLNFIRFLDRQWDKNTFVAQFLERMVSDFEVFLDVYRELNQNRAKGFVVRDATRTTPMHSSRPVYSCDVCGKQNLVPDDHYRCLKCDNYDICVPCQSAGRCSALHAPNHSLMFEPSGPYACDGCGQSPLLFGNRYRCIDDGCRDFDLCTQCKNNQIAKSSHLPSHKMIRL